MGQSAPCFCLCCLSFVFCFFFFKQKTAYEMRISDWSSDVCSSDLGTAPSPLGPWTWRGVVLKPVSSTTSHAGAVEFDGQWYPAYHTADAREDRKSGV